VGNFAGRVFVGATLLHHREVVAKQAAAESVSGRVVLQPLEIFGVPNRIRTGVAAVKEPLLRPPPSKLVSPKALILRYS
jgi:hypothetical protein